MPGGETGTRENLPRIGRRGLRMTGSEPKSIAVKKS